MLQVAINARSSAIVMTHTGAPWQVVRLPIQEQVAWARVVLGNLADYAYRIVTDWEMLRVRPGFFMVLVANDGSPQLAPSDFIWMLASSGGHRAYPEKLVPEDPDLLAHLRRHGDLINADLVPRPQASPPVVWAQQFVSHLTATIADELGRLGNSKWFTFDEVSLHGANTVIMRYTWHLCNGDKKYGFDIDLAGVREHRLRALGDPRARSAAETIATIPFDQPEFRAPTEVDGVTWIRFGAPE